MINTRSNTAYYPSDDSHPNTTGQQKATSEFVPLLNYWYHRWQSSDITIPLYFPHVATTDGWQTEIAIINTGGQIVNGTLRGVSDEGETVESHDVLRAGHVRTQINVADQFTNHASIGYMVFDADSAAVQGYTKFFIAGQYRAAVPAVKEVNTSDIYIPHIASDDAWRTGISLVNTTSTQKDLTITFHNSRTHNDEKRDITLNANQHWGFDIAEDFFDNQIQPDISSAVITNAGGVIGLELFGSLGWGSQLEGILLTGNTSSTLYYPHIGDENWWTGIAAYNTLTSDCPITVTPYDVDGGSLSPVTPDPIAGHGRYVDVVSNLGLPTETAWFRIDSDPTCRLSGLELFGTVVGSQLGAYAGGSGAGANAGIFAKIETDGWTGIAFVNTGDNEATVTLTAYYDTGDVAATKVLKVLGHAKKVDSPEKIFKPQDISGATYIAYTSNSNVVGFQLNGSRDNTMLDGLPALVN